jgi:NAD(P)-dependent dehydrogenase (short-subunit alcohol dehydrogenase family)
MTDQPTALVLGASRGLGLALAAEWCRRGWQVIATQRSPAPGLQALAARYPSALQVETADVDQAQTVRALGERLDGQKVDVLVANAGIARGTEQTPVSIEEQDFLDMMLTNALAPVRALEVLEGLVPDNGVLAVMSSELGSVTTNNGYWTLYSASKAALNMLMKGFAGRRAGDPRAMLLLAPGWVRTDMGGTGATFSIEEIIPLVIDVVEANRNKPGLRFLDRFGNALPW